MRSHRGPVVLEQRVQDRLAAMYDATLAGIDRGLATLLDRLRDAGLLNDTAIVFVGDRGTALGESGLVGDGPMSLGVISQTVLMARTPGVSARQLDEPASVLDAAATVLERLGVRPFAVDPGARAGAASVFVAPGGVLHGRGVVFVGGARNELGLALGGLLALPRASGLALYAPEDDALGQTDVSALRPIARAYAESVLTAYRLPTPDEPGTRVLEASTRPLPLVVETAYQHAGILRR